MTRPPEAPPEAPSEAGAALDGVTADVRPGSPDSLRELLGAALLAAGRPLSVQELGGLLKLGASETVALVTAYDLALLTLGAGFRVEAVGGGYRLVVPPHLARQLSPVLAPPALSALSPAALEVLAIIAYRQPVTRAEIEAMRGGPASTVLTLQERELVRVAGKSPAIGQPLLYATTARFLIEFGLNSLADLPELDSAVPGGQEFSGLLRG